MDRLLNYAKKLKSNYGQLSHDTSQQRYKEAKAYLDKLLNAIDNTISAPSSEGVIGWLKANGYAQWELFAQLIDGVIEYINKYGNTHESLNEDVSNTAAVAFGRMNPPTIAHELLVKTINKQSADPYVYLSHSSDPKKNPLSYDKKVD